jgi:hypothetical protein
MAMDKLQPIIKHHFWIVFGLASILPPVAWWMTTGELAAEISDRSTSLDSTFSGIASGQNVANADWANGANQRIAIQTEYNRLALDRLWNAQRDLMLWPPNVSNWMASCPYRGEIEDPRIKQILPDLYRDDYEREVRRVWLIPEPIDDMKTRIDRGLKQKVVFPYEAMPRTEASKWTLLPPTWQEIWNAQEDLWLLSEILVAVRNTNESTSSITDSYVKQILQVQLFGGKRAAAPAGSSGSSSTGADPMAFMRQSMPTRTAAGALSKPAEFPVSEEFEVSASGAGAAGQSRMYSTAGSEDEGSSPAAGDPNSDENRYVQAEEAYRTRGFKLKVAVHQMQVPNLVRELMNSQYPIEIIRFQQSAMNPEEPGKPTNNRSGYPGSNPYASRNSGFPGEDTGEYSTESPGGSLESPSSSDESSFGFDGSAPGSDGLSGKAYSVPAIANVQLSLQDRDLVELVIIGEIYIYNPPIVNESATEPEATDVTLSSDPVIGDDPAASAVGLDAGAVPSDTAGQPGTPPKAGIPAVGNNDLQPPPAQPGTAESGAANKPTDSSPASDSVDAEPPARSATTPSPASGDSAPPSSDGSQAP